MALEELNKKPVIAQADESIFFNVMPTENLGPLVSVAETGQANKYSKLSLPSFSLSKYRLPLIIGVAVLILGIGGFFLYKQLSKGDSQTPKPEENLEELTPTLQPSGVTTPNDWQTQYFGKEICSDVNICGDASDPDRDGSINGEEFTIKTDPNNPDSDSDGLADGDEVHIFGSNPLQQKTAGHEIYTDADDAKGGFDSTTPGQKFSEAKLAEVKSKMKELGLHQPTLTTLGEYANSTYNFDQLNLSTEILPLDSSIDQSPEAQLSRDTQRVATIKKIGSGLLKYKASQGTFPLVSDFAELVNAIKPYNLVATNYQDPLNINQYIYAYQTNLQGTDFTLTYFSETQKQAIRYNTASAQKDATSDDASNNDLTRKRDLESIRQALLIYSSEHAAGNTAYVFPTEQNYKTELAPKYFTKLPVDPQSKLDYEYKVANTFDSFTLKAILQNPSPGTTGYLCNQEDDCRNY